MKTLKWMLAVAVIATIVLQTRSTQAMVAAPVTRVFSNETGNATFKVVPTGDMKATAILTRVDENGTEKVVWQKPLSNLPGRVFVSNHWEPFVATTDSWANAGGAHSIVVYNPKGEVIADLKGDDFLPKLPAPKADAPLVVMADSGGRNWSFNADISFEPRWNSTMFIVQLYDGEATPVSMQNHTGTLTGAVRKRGEQIRIELKTGAVKRMTGAEISIEQATLKIAPPLKVMTVVEGKDDGNVISVRSGPDVVIMPKH